MSNNLLEKLVNRTLTKEQLAAKVRKDFNLIPDLIHGISSSKAAIRYGCGKILMDLSEEYPEKIYPHWDFFVNLLDYQKEMCFFPTAKQQRKVRVRELDY